MNTKPNVLLFVHWLLIPLLVKLSASFSLSLSWVEKKERKENLPDLETLWMTEHIPCEFPFPRIREREYPRKLPGGSCAPSPALNIYPWGQGVDGGNSLIAHYEKFEDCAILVWCFGLLFIVSLYSLSVSRKLSVWFHTLSCLHATLIPQSRFAVGDFNAGVSVWVSSGGTVTNTLNEKVSEM